MIVGDTDVAHFNVLSQGFPGKGWPWVADIKRVRGDNHSAGRGWSVDCFNIVDLAVYSITSSPTWLQPKFISCKMLALFSTEDAERYKRWLKSCRNKQLQILTLVLARLSIPSHSEAL